MLEPSPISIATSWPSPSTCSQQPESTNTREPTEMRFSPTSLTGGAITLCEPNSANAPDARTEKPF